MAKLQNEKLPKGCNLHIDLGDNCATVAVHQCADHSVGLEVKRLIGGGNAEKSNFDPEAPWHVLRGQLTDKVYYNIFCRGLPPMCRVETYEEEVPKEQVIQTSEKTIVRRTRICCGKAVER